jgi:DNA-binding LytR/AlgR family response regulator
MERIQSGVGFKCLFRITHDGYYKSLAQDQKWVSYLEADGAYCHIHYCSGKTGFITQAMGALAECLHEQGIMHCHKSFTVNITEADVIGGNFIILRNKIQIGIGKLFRNAINFCYIHCGTKSRKYILL